MKIILVNNQGLSRTTHLDLTVIKIMILFIFLIGAPLSVGWWLGDKQSQAIPKFFQGLSTSLNQKIETQAKEIVLFKEETLDQFQAINLQIGKLQARIVRMEALAERVSEVADAQMDEFDFTVDPALGGPSNNIDFSEEVSSAYTVKGLLTTLNDLENQVEYRRLQMSILEELYRKDYQVKQMVLSGLPVSNGFISSNYGYRTDPFSGRKAWHNGVDITGKEGSDVLSVASGIVTFSGERESYGNLVEITHNNQYVTRYGHNSEVLVKLGEIVNKGQSIARMGSTGRSTGPHTHFEVFTKGKAVNPARFIRK